MNTARLSVIVLAGLVGVVGCGETAEVQPGATAPLAGVQLGPARDIIATSLDSMGGLEAWQEVGRVRMTAVVTMYDFEAVPYVNRQKQVLNVRGGTLAVEATNPRGTWNLTSKADGTCNMNVRGLWPADDKVIVIACSTATLLHRLRGPMNFLLTDERPDSAERTRFDGKDVVRVGVAGDTEWAAAYYFDATTGLLRYVTSRGDGPFEYGTVTIYDYAMLPNGMAFPKRIKVVALGDHAMIGEQVLLEADFSDVRIR
jgi:hypothetical protein